MGIVQKWLTAMVALGAGYLVVSNPAGVASAAASAKNLVGGTEVSIITGGKK